MTNGNGSGPPYPQRTDLNRVPITPPTGQTYGKVTQQRQALQQVPAGIPKLPPFSRPTEFPDEPLTAGMTSGPGPGPESLAALPGRNNSTQAMADLEQMRRVLPTLEVLADLPDTSDTFRQLVRQIRGQVRMQ